MSEGWEERLQKLLDDLAVEQERTAVWIDGQIRRSPVSVDLLVTVWDDDYCTTLRVLNDTPNDELLKQLFLARKRCAT